MRTFLTWQFWLSLAVLGGLLFGLTQVSERSQIDAQLAGGLSALRQEHQIDLIAPVFLVQADPGATIERGVTTGRMQVRIDGFRYMTIAKGTPGENRCTALGQLASCVVAADLLGEAVLWFAFLPVEPKNVVTLPPIVELRKDSRVLLANGWVLRRNDTVARVCDDDTASLADFVRTEQRGSTTTFSLDQQLVTTVTCAHATVSSTTVAPTTLPVPGTGVDAGTDGSTVGTEDVGPAGSLPVDTAPLESAPVTANP
jgi:hypothetical protein